MRQHKVRWVRHWSVIVVGALVAGMLATIADASSASASNQIVDPLGGAAVVLDVVEAPDGRLGSLMLVTERDRQGKVRLALMTVSTDLVVSTTLIGRPAELLDFDLASTNDGWAGVYSEGPDLLNAVTHLYVFGSSSLERASSQTGGFALFDSLHEPTQVLVTEVVSEQFDSARWALPIDLNAVAIGTPEPFGDPARAGYLNAFIGAIRIQDGRLVTIEGEYRLGSAGFQATLRVHGGPSVVMFPGSDDFDWALKNHWGGFVLVSVEDGETVLSLSPNPTRIGDDYLVLGNGVSVSGRAPNYQAVRFASVGDALELQTASVQLQSFQWQAAPLDNMSGPAPAIAGSRVANGHVTVITDDGRVIAAALANNRAGASFAEPEIPTTQRGFVSEPITAGVRESVATDPVQLTLAPDSLAVSMGSWSYTIQPDCGTFAHPSATVAPGVTPLVSNPVVRSDGTVVYQQSILDTAGHVVSTELVAIGGHIESRARIPVGSSGSWVFPLSQAERAFSFTRNANGMFATLLDETGARRSGHAPLDRVTDQGDVTIVAIEDRTSRDVAFKVDPDDSSIWASVVIVDGATGATSAGPLVTKAGGVAADPTTSSFAVSDHDGIYLSFRELSSDRRGQAVVGAGITRTEIVSDYENGRYLIFGLKGQVVDVYEVDATPGSNVTPSLLTSISLPHAGALEDFRVMYWPSQGRGFIIVDATNLSLLPFGVGAVTPVTCDLVVPTPSASALAPPSVAPVDLAASFARVAPTGVEGQRSGYWLIDDAGEVHAFGDAPDLGRGTGGGFVDITATPGGTGYWMLTATGQVASRGAIPLGGVSLQNDETAVALAATPSGFGYWIFTSSGTVHALGDAVFFGDASQLTLAANVIDAVAMPDGRGYWMIAADGGVFAFGTAKFYGSVPQVLPGVQLAAPIVGLVPRPNGTGYWLVAADGGVFGFRAPFVGSLPGVLPPGTQLDAPVTGMVSFGDGYLLVGADGGVFNFSRLPFDGSLGGRGVNGVVAIEPFRG